MSAGRPLISVVIATRNSAATLARALDSIFGQTFAGREVLVIDGASTDGTVDLLRRYAPRLAHWESEPDRGLYHAFNKGVARAQGEWLYFLGSDDYLWDATVFERMAPHLARAHPAHRVVYAHASFISESGETLELLGKPWEEYRRPFLQGFMIPHQATFQHRSLFEVHGGFDESYRIGGDYELVLRELKDHAPLFVPGVVVAGYQFGGGSSAPRNSLKVLAEVRRAQRKNGLRLPGPLWCASVARTLLRMSLWSLLGERRAKRLLDGGRSLAGKSSFWTRT